MRLLKRLLGDGGFELVSFNDDDPSPYAILSHTWTEGQEVTYNELVTGAGKDKAGYAKIRFCSERAAADGLEYFWVDTCCIDKSTSDELSTAINSMFRWYQRASKCYVYLSDVPVPDEINDAEAFPIVWQEAFRRSRWFTRGWTLQELLAPASVEFFCKQGKRLGSRVSLEREIHEITKIPITALRGQSLTGFSVEDRMSWAARRTTTLKEDKVYCLLGIFGVFLSLIYGEGEAYATLRLREEIQKRQEGRGTDSSRNLSVFSSLPFLRNTLFVGRTDQLRYLEQHLLVSNSHRRMTIYGLGGCGKSALAIEFAYRVLARHARLVFWVPAISQESFELAFREIGVRLRIPGITDDNADIKKLVRDTLSSEGVDDWLMIVDDADNHEVLLGTMTSDSKAARLRDYLPRSDKGAILFTTRSRKVARTLTPSSVLGLDDMSKAEARQLLERCITKQALLDDKTAVDELLEILTCLPLAIVQAAAFINNNHAGAETELFNERFADPSRYDELDSTIAKTWHISFDQIRRQDSLAAEYLSFMACIDRVNIPQSLLPPGGSLVQQVKALGTLTGYAFITERLQTAQEPDGDKVFDMHRLVHLASVWWLDGHGERATWVNAAVARLEELVPHGGHEKKEVWTTYLSHAIHVAGIDSVVCKATSASLLDRVGRCQASLGQYSAAETMHQQGLSVRERMLGPEHPDTLTSMGNLASVLDRQGKYKEAEAMNRETLVLYKTVLGPKYPDTLTSMSNLALVLYRQGKYKEAEAMNSETLVLCTKVLGAEHPDTLTSMHSLALVLDSRGKSGEAEAMNRETLVLYKTVLGPKHPETLTSMSNLALVLYSQGKYGEAEAMNRETLVLYQTVLGPEHPSTLTSIHNLALVLYRQGKQDGAEAMHREELALCKKVLGPEHPDTLTSMSNLAGVLSEQGKYEEAETVNTETLALYKKVLGPEHPDTLMSMYCHARLLANQYRYDSRHLYEQACAAYGTVLGEDHPTTRACRQHYCQLLALKEQDRFSLCSRDWKET
ncbi:kinesin light chain 1 [Macroventuria anomochaeta]|uniref:Kinesin light chain 1 n=1 Tax=Macroventuria anomochaeta TaxID=301207 RepID=A0ACB6SGB6_9PLEO|nr:kinesin light chain 1 [Macroventuria anomochaeta]KAF2633271.1 kinesin light chain 1 [Macroventuria anomochaeta]